MKLKAFEFCWAQGRAVGFNIGAFYFNYTIVVPKTLF